MNNKLALLVAIVLGVLSIIGIQMYVEGIRRKVDAGKEKVDAYVAARDIDQGEVIREEDVDKIEVARRLIRRLSNTQIKDRKLIVNSRAQTPIKQNQIIQNYHIYVTRNAGRGLELEGGWRAVTVKVDAVTGIAGLVRPGDFVVVMTAFELDGADVGGQKVAQLTTTLLPKVKVLAVDARTDPNAEAFGYRTITLRVQPDEVTRVAHANQFGKIILGLMKDDEKAQRKLFPVTPQSLIKGAADELKND